MNNDEIFWLDELRGKGRMGRGEAIETITICISPTLLALFFSLCVLNGAIFLIPLVICFVAFLVASYFYLTKKCETTF